MTLPRRAADEGTGDTGGKEMLRLLLNDLEMKRTVCMKRSMRCGDEAGDGVVFHFL
jgi:hypothetical protein